MIEYLTFDETEFISQKELYDNYLTYCYQNEITKKLKPVPFLSSVLNYAVSTFSLPVTKTRKAHKNSRVTGLSGLKRFQDGHKRLDEKFSSETFYVNPFQGCPFEELYFTESNRMFGINNKDINTQTDTDIGTELVSPKVVNVDVINHNIEPFTSNETVRLPEHVTSYINMDDVEYSITDVTVQQPGLPLETELQLELPMKGLDHQLVNKSLTVLPINTYVQTLPKPDGLNSQIIGSSMFLPSDDMPVQSIFDSDYTQARLNIIGMYSISRVNRNIDLTNEDFYKKVSEVLAFGPGKTVEELCALYYEDVQLDAETYILEAREFRESRNISISETLIYCIGRFREDVGRKLVQQKFFAKEGFPCMRSYPYASQVEERLHIISKVADIDNYFVSHFDGFVDIWVEALLEVRRTHPLQKKTQQKLRFCGTIFGREYLPLHKDHPQFGIVGANTTANCVKPLKSAIIRLCKLNLGVKFYLLDFSSCHVNIVDFMMPTGYTPELSQCVRQSNYWGRAAQKMLEEYPQFAPVGVDTLRKIIKTSSLAILYGGGIGAISHFK